jgi:DNA ligase-1
MKCVPFETKRLENWSTPYICQPKLDGIRCVALNISGKYVLMSANSNIISSVPHINEALEESFADSNTSFDGELYIHNSSFEHINSIVSRTVNPHPESASIEFHIFDIVNESLPMIFRLIFLNDFKESVKNNCLQFVEYKSTYNLEQTYLYFTYLIKKNYEGIIVRDQDGLYVFKRSTNIMKFKPRKSDIYKVIGFTEEVSKDGIPKDTLGSLMLSSDDSTTFEVGSGFSLKQRKDIWNNRENYLNRSVKVLYQNLTNKKIPRFPIFCEFVEE